MIEGMLKRVLNAQVADVLPSPTPLDEAPLLTRRLGRRVLLKREDRTPIFSFKLRGAYNKVASLSPQELALGVVAASAGNHAQGVAYACVKLGAPCTIVMPVTTPAIKVEAVRAYAAKIELVGDSYAEAAVRAAELARTTGAVVIPPFDDLDVIAGQGTIALEILRQAPRDLASIFVPVGGGGLAAGVCSVVKALRPSVRVIGVEPEDCAGMRASLDAGHPVTLDYVGIFADGVAVKRVGDHTFDLCKHLDDCVTVSIDQICAAVRDGFEDTRILLEPAGALAIAGLKLVHASGTLPAGSAVAVASGSNMNFARLGYVAERADVGELREAIFAVTIPERKGAFFEFSSVIGDRAITEFNYRLATRHAAHVFVGLEVRDQGEIATLQARFLHAGYGCTDLSADEVAKNHVRHMVGGVAPAAQEEVLYTFEFPERPGAFKAFLSTLGGRWNISLFHYRNHGAAFGRVLCGLEVPVAERHLLESTFQSLGYAYRAVTEDSAIRYFLTPGA